MKRLATSIAVLALLIPLQGAIAGSAATSGTEVAFHRPGSSYWQIPGGDGFYYGTPGDTPLLCDWDGDGVATAGVYRESTGYLLLSNRNATRAADYEFYYGIPGDRPICGDWNGDGTDTIGIYRPTSQRFYLRNQNTHGVGDKDFQFGFTNGIPFAGDFNGDGIDTVGVRDPKNGWLELAPGNYSGTAVVKAYFGSSTDTLLVGDWDGDGTDRIALYKPATDTLDITNLFGERIAATYDLGNAQGIPLAAEFNPASGLTTTNPKITAPPPPAAAPAPEPPPASAFNPAAAGDGTFGPGIKGNNIRPRTPTDTDWAIGPWLAPRSGNIDSLALYFVFHNENYFQGTGGINRFSIRPDVGGQPGTAVLGELTIANPMASGGIWSDRSRAEINADHFKFENLVPLTKGARYWIVGENLHPNPSSNWVGINSISYGDGVAGTAYVHMETAPGSGVFERFEYPGEGRFIGLFDLTYQAGDGFGQGYWFALFNYDIGGSQKAREVITPSATHVVSQLRVWSERTGGSGPLTATLSTGGKVVAQASATGSGWITFPMSANLTAGTTFYLEFSAPAGTSYSFYALRENSGWSDGSHFVEGYAELNSGSGWIGGWPIWGSTSKEGDLMFSFSAAG